ncbi:MAG: site-specific integrase [Hydrogeniiclostridium sp.]
MEQQKTGIGTAASWQPELVLTPELIDSFIAHLKEKNYIQGTVNRYEQDLRQFYADLPEDKCVHRDTLSKYREKLLANGYAPRTVNLRISSANSLFRYLGLKEYQLDNQLRPKNDNQPEISRSEYRRLLRTARALGRESEYLLIKLFASTGITILEVPKVTVEAVEAGRIEIQPSNNKQVLRLPRCLQKELLDYAARNGIHRGPIFLSRGGKTMSRTNITQKIHRLCAASGVPEEKGNPRCLKKLYQTTRAGIEANFDLLVEQAMERQLEAEQADVGWEEGTEHTPLPAHMKLRLRRGSRVRQASDVSP